MFVYALCLQFFGRVDLLMLGWLGQPADVIGQYGAAQNIAQAPGLFAMVFTPLLIAALRKADLAGAWADAEGLRMRSIRVAAGLWALSAPVAAGAPRLAVLLFGPAFAGSGGMLGWLGVAAGAGVTLSVLSAHEVAAGRYFRPLTASIPMLILAVALLAAWIPGQGGEGAARASAVAATVAAFIAQGFAGLAVVPARVLDLMRALLSGLAGYLGTWLASSAGAPSPLDILLGCLLTVAALMVTGLVSMQDVRRVVAALMARRPLEQESA
jgi:O-antigen/teichoic acid export membrane protein